MNITIEYYAALREQANKSNEIIETQAKNPRELYKELNKKYQFSLKVSQLKVAVNEEYESFDYEFKSGDTIVFIPPVAGG